MRSDRGDEYELKQFNEFCKQPGIIYETIPLYSPESNGIVERKNRTLKNMINAMLIISDAPLNLWGRL